MGGKALKEWKECRTLRISLMAGSRDEGQSIRSMAKNNPPVAKKTTGNLSENTFKL